MKRDKRKGRKGKGKVYREGKRRKMKRNERKGEMKGRQEGR